ncbi:MAG: flagellar hook basal-body protein [Candidatus Coatesbacteria bacterium]|nr:flagellar hook basal-body protein [Candidatus Coatesbacteria bacterium]
MFGAIMSGLTGLYSSLFGRRASSNGDANLGVSGLKSVLAGASISQNQGLFRPRDEPQDLFIEGRGFFKVIDDEANTVYTRAGRFSVDSGGYLATEDGFRLSPPVKVGTHIEDIRVSADGIVTGKNGQTGQIEELGRLQLSQFPNPSALTPLRSGKCTFSAESGSPMWGPPGTGGLGYVLAGKLETSSVDPAHEMVNQMLCRRGAEANVECFQTSNEVLVAVLDSVE